MKLSTSKTARQIRRREISARLLTITEALTPSISIEELLTIKKEFRELILELHEISAIDANTPTRSRKRP